MEHSPRQSGEKAQVVTKQEPPDPRWSGQPITPDEAEAYARTVAGILGASGPHRRQLIGEAIVDFGFHFFLVCGQVAELADDLSLMAYRWVNGARLTERADEAELRVVFAQELQAVDSKMRRAHARAILELPVGHPRRDLQLAFSLLREQLEHEEDAERVVSAITDLLHLELCPYVSDEERQRYQAQADSILPQVRAPDVVRRYLHAVTGLLIRMAVEARDSGDEATRERLLSQARTRLTDSRLKRGQKVSDLMLLGTVARAAGDEKMAVDLLTSALDHPQATTPQREAAAHHAAVACVVLGRTHDAVELWYQIIDGLQDRYAAAVADDEITSSGEAMSEVCDGLVSSLAALDRWDDVADILERAKSMRFRARHALRSTTEGRSQLTLERELYDLTHGRPNDSEGRRRLPAIDQDRRYEDQVLATTRVLEELRRSQPTVESRLLASPTLVELAAQLDPEEALVVLGLVRDATIVLVIAQGDVPLLGAFKNTDWPFERWASTLTSDVDGWALALLEPTPDIDDSAALQRALDAADEAVGSWVQQLLRHREIDRLIVAPHRSLHLIPWNAVASLVRWDVTPVPSTALWQQSRSKRVPELSGAAVAIIDPTLDLPVCEAQLSTIRDFAEHTGLVLTELPRGAATVEIVRSAISDAGLVHFSCHGLSFVTNVDRSALLLACPESASASDVLQWARRAAWHERNDGTRAAEVPGVGWIAERPQRGTETIERWVQLESAGTIWQLERGGTTRLTAAHWSAREIGLDQPFTASSLAVLLACSSASSGLSVLVDEHSGLPAALELAGATTVVAPQWPVDESYAALFADEFYTRLGRRRGTVDVRRVVHRACASLRSMSGPEAANRAVTLRSRVHRGRARFALEAAANRWRGSDAPFGDPWQWAAFTVTGLGMLRIGSVRHSGAA